MLRALGVSSRTQAVLAVSQMTQGQGGSFAWRLPQHFKIRNGQSKWLLRQVQVAQDNLMMSNKTLVLRDDARLLDEVMRSRPDMKALANLAPRPKTQGFP